MTQAERTRTTEYVLAGSSRWLHRRRDTKKINIAGSRKKNNRENKNEKRKTKSRKQGIEASKQENRAQGVSIATKIFSSLLQRRHGDLATPSAIFFLLSSATVSSVTAAAVESPPSEQINKNQNKTAWTRGL